MLDPTKQNLSLGGSDAALEIDIEASSADNTFIHGKVWREFVDKEKDTVHPPRMVSTIWFKKDGRLVGSRGKSSLDLVVANIR